MAVEHLLTAFSKKWRSIRPRAAMSGSVTDHGDTSAITA